MNIEQYRQSPIYKHRNFLFKYNEWLMQNAGAGREVNETDADLAALKIYLGLDYSTTAAEEAFKKVFDSPHHKKRYEILKEYIEKFEK